MTERRRSRSPRTGWDDDAKVVLHPSELTILRNVLQVMAVNVGLGSNDADNHELEALMRTCAEVLQQYQDDDDFRLVAQALVHVSRCGLPPLDRLASNLVVDDKLNFQQADGRLNEVLQKAGELAEGINVQLPEVETLLVEWHGGLCGWVVPPKQGKSSFTIVLNLQTNPPLGADNNGVFGENTWEQASLQAWAVAY